MKHIHKNVKLLVGFLACLLIGMTWLIPAHAQTDLTQFDRQEAQVIERYLAGELQNPTIQERIAITRFEDARANQISKPIVNLTSRDGEDILGYWNQNSNDLPSGGFGFLADPDVFPQMADIGSATLTVGGGFLDTSVNTSGDLIYTWLPSTAGTTINALNDDPAGGTITVQGGTLVEGVPANNGSYIQFMLSMADHEDLNISYATRGTGTGFNTQTWSWSTDGDTFTDFATVTGTTATSFFLAEAQAPADLNGAENAYLRVTFTGATGATGNNRVDNILLTATPTDGGGGGGFAYFQGFDDVELPGGWSIDDVSGSEVLWGFTDETGNFIPGNLFEGGFAAIDSDAAGSGVNVHASLISEPISVAGLSNVSLSFDHHYRHAGTNASASVYVSNDDGDTWQEVVTYTTSQGSSTAFSGPFAFSAVTADFDVTDLVDGAETIHVKFDYDDGGAWAWYWLIDNVTVYEPAATPNPVALVSPANEAENVFPMQTLSWAVGSGTAPTSYDVYFGTSSNPAFAGNVTETSWETPELEFSTTYYWNVVAKNDAGEAEASPTWSFTTFDDPTLTPPFVVDFEGTFPPAGWIVTSGSWDEGTIEFEELGGANQWVGSNFGNIADDGAATKINLYVTGSEVYPVAERWLITPEIEMGDGSTDYELQFDVKVTPWNSTASAQLGPNDLLAVVASVDGGETWSGVNTLYTRTAEDGEIPADGLSVTLDLAGVTGSAKLAFYAERLDGTTPDIEVHVGNVRMREQAEGPVLVVTPDELDFGTIFAGDFVALDFSVTNDGSGTMTGEVESDNELFVGDFGPFSVDAGETVVFTAIYNPVDAIGVHTGTITVTADDADGSPATISLTGESIEPPVVGVDPESFDVSAVVGAPTETRTLTISNTGGADLDFVLGVSFNGDAGKKVVEPQTFTYTKNGITQIMSNEAIKAPFAAGKAFNDDGVISFEASEGFEPGFIGGQNGWTTYSTNTTKPIVSAANASDGDWSLELSRHDGLGDGASVGAFSPLFLIDEDVMTISYDILVEATGGSDYDVIVQAPSQGFLTARVKFFWQGGIRLVDFNAEGAIAMIQTGVDFPVDEWFELTIQVDRNADEIYYFLDGELFWTGGIFGGDVFEQVVVLHDNFNDGEAGFVDNIRTETEPVWLTADITSGTVAPGESVDVTLFFDTEFEAGSYSADLVVFSNDPANDAVSIPVTFDLSGPVEVGSIAELLAISEPNDGVIYTLTNEVYLVFTSNFRGRKVLVDGTGGILIDDPGEGVLRKDYNRYDGITGLTVEVAIFGDTIQLLPVADAGDATSEDNLVLPSRAFIPDLGIADQSQLVFIEDVTFVEQGEFANQTTYTIVDGDGNQLAVRTDRIVESIIMDDEETYIGTPIPTDPVSVAGYVSIFQGAPQLVIRTLDDFVDPTAIGSFSLVSPPNNAEVSLVPGSENMVSVEWTAAAGEDVEYLWFANASSLPLMVPAHSIEVETAGFSASEGDLVDLIESLFGETEIGDTFTLDWAVYAYNDNGVRHSDQVWTVTFVIAEEPAGENVTFSINMTLQEDLGVFQPDLGDKVFARGSFNDWSAVDGQELVDDGSGVFSVSLFVEGEADTEHAYKYYIMAGDGRELPNTGWENNGVGPVGDNGDRLLVLIGEDQVLDTVWFNNEEGVNVDNEPDIPMEFALNQNYPNPFNPTTQIQYALPEATEVRIDVFNVMGQRVATLVNGQQNAGHHNVTFDANRLASGVYLYRMQAGSFVQTQKMLLVK
jgi:hypothetical protein